MPCIEIKLDLDPVPWAAPKFSFKNRVHSYDPREKDKRAARYLIRQQYHKEPIATSTCLFFVFVFPIPKSASKAKRALMLNREIIPTRCDCTNLQKLYEDCLKGIVITDDRYVAQVTSTKFYAEKGSVAITVYY